MTPKGLFWEGLYLCPDNNTTTSDLDLLIANINDLAREIGEMDPNDPVRAMRVQELFTLTELSKSIKTQTGL